MFEELL